MRRGLEAGTADSAAKAWGRKGVAARVAVIEETNSRRDIVMATNLAPRVAGVKAGIPATDYSFLAAR